MRKNLEERLIRFAVSIIEICKELDNSFVERHYAGQLIRSSSSTALNYGEAQSAESKKDFIHKISVVLKEVREVNISLKIIKDAQLSEKEDLVLILIQESHELVSIFYRTVQTAKKNVKI